jgi:membrane protease YdiL (CAAX protease family)
MGPDFHRYKLICVLLKGDNSLSNNIKTEGISIVYILLGTIVYFILGIVIIYLWKQSQFYSYLIEIFSFHQFKRDLFYGIVLAVILQVYVFFLIKIKKAYFPNTVDSNLLVTLCKQSKKNSLIIAVAPGICEEILFRAALLGVLISLLGELIGGIVVTILFTAFHYRQYKGQPYLILFIMLLSIFTNYLFIILGTIWGPIVVHILSNLASTLWIRDGKIYIAGDQLIKVKQ